MTAPTLDLVKRYLRYELDAIDDDTMMTVALAAGVEWVEGYTGSVIAGADPDTVPVRFLHAVLLYAGMFDRLRDGDASNMLGPIMTVCARPTTL